MPITRPFTLLLTLFMLAAAPVQAGWDPREKAELEHQAQETVRLFRQRDPSLNAFFDRAAGWAVFPTVGKGGFWIGGAYGEGVVYAGGKAVGYSELKQVSVGFQFGGQAYSEIIFFRDQAALQRFQSGKLEFDAQASGVVADKGAGANADYHKGVAIFTLIKGGLMAEASVGGQTFSFHPR